MLQLIFTVKSVKELNFLSNDNIKIQTTKFIRYAV